MTCWMTHTDSLIQRPPSQLPALKQQIHSSHSNTTHGVFSAHQPHLLKGLLS